MFKSMLAMFPNSVIDPEAVWGRGRDELSILCDWYEESDPLIVMLLREIRDRERSCFLTGSRAYGEPREDSDIDVCVHMRPEELGLIGCRIPGCKAYNQAIRGMSGKLGVWNLIMFSAFGPFYAWAAANRELVQIAPCSRALAISRIDRQFKIAGCDRFDS